MKKRKNQPGFTLLELLFAIIVLGVMMSIVLTTIIGMLRFYTFANTVRENQQNARNIIDSLAREVRFGTLVMPQSNPGSILCVADTKNKRLTKYALLNNSIVRTQYSYANSQLTEGEECNESSGLTVISENVAVTTPKMFIKSFEVIRTEGAQFATNTDVAAVIVRMSYRTGSVDDSGDCKPGNIYCSPLNLETAINIRGGDE